jgi:succinate dehydrogenase / fumarate reductase cytochrome b subunit
MANSMTMVWSTVGRKFVNGVTGLILVLFLVAHLLGNLLLFVGRDAFNGYAHFLEHLAHGWAIYAAEAGLILFFVLHIGAGVSVVLSKRAARSTRYIKVTGAGGTSRRTISSRTMILTGLVILVFVVIHVRMFKFGDTDMVMLHGREVRDLYTLVVYSFKSVPIALSYTVVMVLLGMHLRHGIWSVFQTLGVSNPRFTGAIYAGGVALALLLAVGFLLFPILILLFYENPARGGGL